MRKPQWAACRQSRRRCGSSWKRLGRGTGGLRYWRPWPPNRGTRTCGSSVSSTAGSVSQFHLPGPPHVGHRSATGSVGAGDDGVPGRASARHRERRLAADRPRTATLVPDLPASLRRQPWAHVIETGTRPIRGSSAIVLAGLIPDARARREHVDSLDRRSLADALAGKCVQPLDEGDTSAVSSLSVLLDHIARTNLSTPTGEPDPKHPNRAPIDTSQTSEVNNRWRCLDCEMLST